MKKSLVLTGMMGSGKSSIGKILSKELKMDFFDIDKIIEKKEKISIEKIFQLKGEVFFRNLEKKITLKFLNKAGTIISLGGGAFMNTNIRKKALSSCISFWLDVDLNTLVKRVNNKTSKRPLLINKNSTKEMEKIFNDRAKYYALANFRIRCKNQNKKLIVEKILKIYEKNLNKN